MPCKKLTVEEFNNLPPGTVGHPPAPDGGPPDLCGCDCTNGGDCKMCRSVFAAHSGLEVVSDPPDYAAFRQAYADVCESLGGISDFLFYSCTFLSAAGTNENCSLPPYTANFQNIQAGGLRPSGINTYQSIDEGSTATCCDGNCRPTDWALKYDFFLNGIKVEESQTTPFTSHDCANYSGSLQYRFNWDSPCEIIVHAYFYTMDESCDITWRGKIPVDENGNVVANPQLVFIGSSEINIGGPCNVNCDWTQITPTVTLAPK